jgi:hypothetical protein
MYSKYGAVHLWSSTAVADLFAQVGFSGACVEAVHSLALNGDLLLDLSPEDLHALHITSSMDKKRFALVEREIRARVERQSRLGEAGLLDLRSVNRRGFTATVLALELVPRTTLLYLWYYSADGNALQLFDSGSDRPEYSSLSFWAWWLVAPHVILARHVWSFAGTNWCVRENRGAG